MTLRLSRVAAAAIVAVVAVLAHAGPAVAAAASPKKQLTVAPPALRPLTIQTVPAIAGARFSLNGRLLVTGRDGTARTTMTKTERDSLAENLAAHLTVASPTVAIRPGVRAQFAGWYDGGYQFTAKDKSGQVLRAAYDTDFLTSFSFARPDGTSVNPVGLGDIQLQASGSATVVIHKDAPVWLRGIKVASAAGHLDVNDVEYKVSSVSVHGNNVVHSDQQHFIPSHQAHVVLQLLLFTLTLKTHDVLFGFTPGSAIDLKYADGTLVHVPLRHGSATFTDVPRGNYALTVHAPGLASDKALSISKSQTATLQIISWIDLAVVLAIVVAVSGALIFIGRSRRRARSRSSKAETGRSVDMEELVLESSASAR